MKHFTVMIFALTLLFLASSCEHKELCYNHPHYRSLRVEFDWSRISNHERPSGMRVVFFPIDGASKPWIFDFPKNEGRTIELPENDYAVITYNYDSDGIIWESENSYSLLTATTKESIAPDESVAKLTPPWLCGDNIDLIQLKDLPDNTVKTITLFPTERVCRYTYEINGIRNLHKATDIRASLSDMSGSLLMADDLLPDGLSESLHFGGIISDVQVKGGFYTFGCSQNNETPNIFTLYIKTASGNTHIITSDVSEQIHSIPISGHLADVHIVINLDYEITDDTSGSGGAGFDAEVDDWTDINQDILC